MLTPDERRRCHILIKIYSVVCTFRYFQQTSNYVEETTIRHDQDFHKSINRFDSVYTSSTVNKQAKAFVYLYADVYTYCVRTTHALKGISEKTLSGMHCWNFPFCFLS